MVLPKNCTVVPIELQEGHDTKIGGHSGFLKTYKRVIQDAYCPSMKDIMDYVSRSVCQQNRYLALSPSGLLYPLPVSKLI